MMTFHHIMTSSLDDISWQEQEAAAPDPDIAETRKQMVQAAEEEVEHYVKLLEDAERQQKEVFLIVVQVIIIIEFSDTYLRCNNFTNCILQKYVLLR